MKFTKGIASAVMILFCSFWLAGNASAANAVTNADELVTQHLDSIASSKVRADLKNHLVQGPVEYKILVGGAGVLDGKAVLISEGKKFQFMMKLPNNDYRGEQIVFDGDKDKVAFSTARQTRSAFGDFMFGQDAAIREGLLGGTLSTSWPLLSLEERKPKLTFGGLKKVDGQEVYELRYRPRKNSDLDIQMYFDAGTYRHVQTVYSYSVSRRILDGSPSATPIPTAPPGGSAETAMAGQQLTRYRLQEKFSDFKTVDGVTLPTHYDIQFSQELQNGHTTLTDWDMKGLEITSNIQVDPKNFEVK